MSNPIFTVPTHDALERIGAVDGAEIIVWNMESLLPPEVAERVKGILVPNYFFSKEGMGRIATLPHLAFIQLPSAGFEHAVAFVPQGVLLANGAGVHDAETSELAVGLALASLRGIDRSIVNMPDEHWEMMLRPSLADRRVTVLGFGNIGRALAARLLPFEVELRGIAAHARTEQISGRDVQVSDLSSLDDILSDTEVLFVIIPANDSTVGLLDARRLALLPDRAVVVNVARGPIVDTEALVAELQSGRIAAALDVTDPEPLPAGHPLWHTPNTIVTPHIGGYTTATDPRVAKLFRGQIIASSSGKPLANVVVGEEAQA